MPAYLIGHITVKDPDGWSIYVEGVRESLIPFDAEEIKGSGDKGVKSCRATFKNEEAHWVALRKMI